MKSPVPSEFDRLLGVKRYPLESLFRLRREQRDQRTAEFSERVSATRERERRLNTIQTERHEAEQAAEKLRRIELERAQQDEARAVDLQRMGAYELRVQRELLALRQEESAESKRVHQARQAEGCARDALSHADANARVIARHRGTFEDEARAAEERREEQEALEIHTARSAK